MSRSETTTEEGKNEFLWRMIIRCKSWKKWEIWSNLGRSVELGEKSEFGKPAVFGQSFSGKLSVYGRFGGAVFGFFLGPKGFWALFLKIGVV